MSYDLMVLDKHERFKGNDDFLKWYDEVTCVKTILRSG